MAVAPAHARDPGGKLRMIGIEVRRAPGGDLVGRRLLAREIDRVVGEGPRRAEFGVVRARIQRGAGRVANRCGPRARVAPSVASAVLLPPPRIGADRVEVAGRAPLEHRGRARRIRRSFARRRRAAAGRDARNRPPAGPLESCDDFEHRMSAAAAEIHRQRAVVSLRDMAHARARKRRPGPARERNRGCRFRPACPSRRRRRPARAPRRRRRAASWGNRWVAAPARRLAHHPRRMRSRRIEPAQRWRCASSRWPAPGRAGNSRRRTWCARKR